MLKTVIFDFDGVIAESVEVKTEAFRELFKDHSEIVDDVEQFHLENGGMSRYDKFRYIYANMLKEELTEDRFNQLCDSFHWLVIDKVVKAPYVEGAMEILNFCKGKYHTYIVSGTPLDEIKEVVSRRKLDEYFLGVYGSPDTKTDLINGIIEENGYNRKEVLFIGDSKNDLKAAEETDIVFFAREIDQDKEWIKSKKVKKVFKDLVGIKTFLQKDLKA